MSAWHRAPMALRKGMLKRPWGRQLLAPLAHELRPDRWIFVVGCYSSGTTLLRDLLGRHQEIDALPSEGVRLTDALPRPEDVGWHRMWCRCLDEIRLSPDPSERDRAARIRRHWSLALPAKPANILEKSIANTARLPFLQAHFGPAYFIHLVRNGYAVAEGLRRKGQPRRFGRHEFGDAYPMAMCAEQWQVSLQQIETDGDLVEHLLEVRYEDLVAQPESELARITEFLQLPILALGGAQGDFDIHGVRSKIQDMNGQSIARLSTQDLDAIDSIAHSGLTRCGYARA